MDEPRDLWATAVALALLDQAQREGRLGAARDRRRREVRGVVKPEEALPDAGFFVSAAAGPRSRSRWSRLKRLGVVRTVRAAATPRPAIRDQGSQAPVLRRHRAIPTRIVVYGGDDVPIAHSGVREPSLAVESGQTRFHSDECGTFVRHRVPKRRAGHS
jgi:hypothetical protein